MNQLFSSVNRTGKYALLFASLMAFFLSFVCVFSYAYWKVANEVKQDAKHILNFTEHEIDDAIINVKQLDKLDFHTCDAQGQHLLRQYLYQHLNGGLFLMRRLDGKPWLYCSLMGPVRFDVPPNQHAHYVALPGRDKMILTMATYHRHGRKQSSLFLAYFGRENISTVRMPKAESYSFFQPSSMASRKIELRLTNGDEVFSIGQFDDSDARHIITYSYRYPIYIRSALDMQRVYKTAWHLGILFLPVYTIFFVLCFYLIKAIFKARLSMGFQLYRAAKNKELKAFYQPIVDVSTGQVIAAEALIRWIKEDGTVEKPGRFISELEQSELITEVTLDILERMPKDLAEILAQADNFRCSINLVPEHLENDEFVEHLERLARDGFPCHQLALEITERLPLRDLAKAQATIARFRALGICVELDDAGTGYGGASYLQELHIDVMKIDKLFVDTLMFSDNKSQVLDAYLQMARTLNLEIIAEGVETQAQSQALLEKGVCFQQGYLYAKPLAAKDFVLFWQQNCFNNRCRIFDGIQGRDDDQPPHAPRSLSDML